MTPEEAREIGVITKEKSVENMPMRNAPTYLYNAVSTLRYFGEQQFQYIKDIQIEASVKGCTKLRESPHYKKYMEIMNQVEYGNNPDIYITGEQRAKRDRFEFTGSRVMGITNFKIGVKTRNDLYVISQNLDMESNDIDLIAYLIGYQDMFSSISQELLNPVNMELLKTLTNEVNRVNKFLERRNLHKIIEYCPLEVDYISNSLSWRL